MSSTKVFLASLGLVLLVTLVFPHWSLAAVEEGDSLAGLVIPAPGTEEAVQYFGLGKNESFALEQLQKEYALFKVVDAYCPICHGEAPVFNRLYNRIQEDASLADKLCIFIVAPDAAPTEVDFLYKTWKTPYPILGDPDHVLPAKISSLNTPYTILADREGRVLYAHFGPMPEIREMVRKLKEILSR